MREVSIDSAEDLEALPKGEWFSVPKGTKVEWLDEEDLERVKANQLRGRSRLARLLGLDKRKNRGPDPDVATAPASK